MPSKAHDTAVENFVERIGLIAEEEGLPRIAGRMLAFLIIHQGPVSFADMAERLQVSRASISTNSRVLLQLGVMQRTSRPGERQDFFELCPHPYRRLMDGYIERMGRTLKLVRETRNLVEGSDVKRRLRDMEGFYALTLAHFTSLGEELAEVPPSRAGKAR